MNLFPKIIQLEIAKWFLPAGYRDQKRIHHVIEMYKSGIVDNSVNGLAWPELLKTNRINIDDAARFGNLRLMKAFVSNLDFALLTSITHETDSLRLSAEKCIQRYTVVPRISDFGPCEDYEKWLMDNG